MELKQPHDKELERTMLGSVFFDCEAFTVMLQKGVTLDSFYVPQHSAIFRAMDALREEGEPIDQFTMTKQLREMGMLDRIGGEATIAAMSTAFMNAAGIEKHCETLRKLEMRRRVIGNAIAIQSLAQDDTAEHDSILDVLRAHIETVEADFKPKPRGLTDQIRDFVMTTQGNFSTTECNNFLGLTTRDNKKKVTVILGRLLKEGIIARAGTKNGIFRRIDTECTKLDIVKADMSIFPFFWPLGIETYADIMPHNVVVIAGESNVGKTAFLLNAAHMNMNGKVPIHYFTCEGGEAELLMRVKLFDDGQPEDWRVNFYERYSDFADVIRPDEINIIDFLEIHEDFYRIGGIIKDIHDRLRKGIAIIAIQKDPKSDFARGGSATIEKARLYISLKYDPKERCGICQIVKAKKWRLPEVNPNGLSVKYKLIHGAKFRVSEEGWVCRK